jgi:hypothetical protein
MALFLHAHWEFPIFAHIQPVGHIAAGIPRSHAGHFDDGAKLPIGLGADKGFVVTSFFAIGSANVGVIPVFSDFP